MFIYEYKIHSNFFEEKNLLQEKKLRHFFVFVPGNKTQIVRFTCCQILLSMNMGYSSIIMRAKTPILTDEN